VKPRPLRSARLDRRIRIERDGPVAHNGYTEAPREPVVLAPRWAEVVPGAGSETIDGEQEQATAPTLFRIRWAAALDPNAPGGINPRDRVRYPAKDSGRLHDVVSAVEIGRREGIEITAVARTDT